MSGTRKCPQCAEMVQLDAKVCRFCSYDFVRHQPAKPPKNSFHSCMTAIAAIVAILILLAAIGAS